MLFSRNNYVYYHISESGFDYTIQYKSKTIKEFFVPFIEELFKIFIKNKKEILIVGIAGPPGSGKSTISALFKKLLKEKDVTSFILPLDGFHLKNKELKEKKISYNNRVVSLYEKKGAKETYDAEKLLECMKKLREKRNFYWPVYLRTTHEPLEKGIYLSEWNSVFIIEGNYLFIGEHPWKRLMNFFDIKIFIRPKKHFLKKRIVHRKYKGGYAKKEAHKHFRLTDSVNIQEVLNLSKGYQYVIEQKGKFSYTLRKIL